jgi:hypothetical protein
LRAIQLVSFVLRNGWVQEREQTMSMSENIGYEPTIGKDTISQASEHERDKSLGQVKEQSSSEDQNWGTLGDLMERKA